MKFYWLILGFFLNTTVKSVKCFFGLQHCALCSSGKYIVRHCHSCLQLPWQTSVIYHGPLSCWAWWQLEIILHSVLKAATAKLAQEVEIISHPCSGNSLRRSMGEWRNILELCIKHVTQLWIRHIRIQTSLGLNPGFGIN